MAENKPKIGFFEAMGYAVEVGKIVSDIIVDVFAAKDPDSDGGEDVTRDEVKSVVVTYTERLVDFIWPIAQKKNQKRKR